MKKVLEAWNSFCGLGEGDRIGNLKKTGGLLMGDCVFAGPQVAWVGTFVTVISGWLGCGSEEVDP